MRALIADDHPLYREAVRLRLERQLSGTDVVEVGTLEELLRLKDGKSQSFDLILLDLHMPGMMGGETVRKILKAFPESAIVLVSGAAEASDVRRAVDAGARGFIPKTLSPELFAGAIGMIVAGGTFLPAEILKTGAAGGAARTAAAGDAQRLADLLTPREQQVLVQLAAGASNKEIARDLGLTEVTIKLHVRQILRKVNARNRSEAASIATRAGLI